MKDLNLIQALMQRLAVKLNCAVSFDTSTLTYDPWMWKRHEPKEEYYLFVLNGETNGAYAKTDSYEGFIAILNRLLEPTIKQAA